MQPRARLWWWCSGNPFDPENDEAWAAALEGGAQAFVALTSGLWVVLSSTVIQPAGGFVGVRADTVASKTFGAAGGSLDLSTTGQIALLSPAGTSYRVVKNGSLEDTITSTLRQTLSAGGLTLSNTTPVIILSGTSDTRSFMDTVGFCANTPSAGGTIDSATYSSNYPIKNGSTIAAGDIVEWDPNNNNFVIASGAGSTNPQLGVCITGGTGNAGGTVFARVAWRGVVTTLLADAAGVTAGHYGAAGATTANRLLSAATITPNSFCRVLKTAAGGVGTTIHLGLT